MSAIPAIPSFLLGVVLVLFCSMILVAAGFAVERIAAARGNFVWFGAGCLVAAIAVAISIRR